MRTDWLLTCLPFRTQSKIAAAVNAKATADVSIVHYNKRFEKHGLQLAAYDETLSGLEDTLNVRYSFLLTRLTRLCANLLSTTKCDQNRIMQASSICDRPVVKKKRAPTRIAVEILSAEKALKEREKKQGGTAQEIALLVATTKAAATVANNAVNELTAFIAVRQIYPSHPRSDG